MHTFAQAGQAALQSFVLFLQTYSEDPACYKPLSQEEYVLNTLFLTLYSGMKNSADHDP